ncbi:unnamed protein product [Aspergillus oryzae]|uniref:Unnamed protein product n=1 Tax=Aspergillus oryzae TaxID=5062 RepID=A0AAN4YQ99_ASPOZ|nr:unnamed protein product [Aspergillus oryzae]GMG35559.1 unnamed protein product [Aspergillus oryzae]
MENAPSRSHLESEKITNPAVDTILSGLAIWLNQTANFEKEGENLEKCVDQGLVQACRPLLDILKIDQKVCVSLDYSYLSLTNKIKRRWGYTVLQTGPGPARFHNTKGPAFVVPIHITGCPTASGVELIPGSTLYITEEIEVGPGLVGLFIAVL